MNLNLNLKLESETVERIVVFSELAGGHVLSKYLKERHSPPWDITFQFVFRG
jgi:Holliday junction resolvase